MKVASKRDNFTNSTKTTLAKRAGFLCSICKVMTVGPSNQSPYAVTNIGVAAHICAASPGGARYNPSMSSFDRSDIKNGIWLCQNDATMIDCDSSTWNINTLLTIKEEHELYVTSKISKHHLLPHNIVDNEMHTIRYAFFKVSEITIDSYRWILSPILKDKKIDDNSELGLLMCSNPDWTIFVDAEWLRWRLDARHKKYPVPEEIPSYLVYGILPAWPDTFYEFLIAIVETDSTFVWHRHPDGYLMLAQ